MIVNIIIDKIFSLGMPSAALDLLHDAASSKKPTKRLLQTASSGQ